MWLLLLRLNRAWVPRRRGDKEDAALNGFLEQTVRDVSRPVRTQRIQSLSALKPERAHPEMQPHVCDATAAWRSRRSK